MKQSLLVAALFSLFLAACGDNAATPEASAPASEVVTSEVAPEETPVASEEVAPEAPAASEEVAPEAPAEEAPAEASAQ